MDLRQLRYFVAVADDLSFTRAARRLHVSQSALSVQVRALERELGSALLTRTTRQVTLTAAGLLAVASARRILEQTDELVAAVRAQERSEGNTLYVGCLGAVPSRLLARVCDGLAVTRPDLRIELRTLDFGTFTDALVDRTVDIGITYGPFVNAVETFAGEPGDFELVVAPLAHEPRVVALASGHRLASRPSISPRELISETFIDHGSAFSTRWREFWMLKDENDGKLPAVQERPALELADWLMQIIQGRGIDTAPAIMSEYYPWPGIRYVPLTDAPAATLAALTLSEAANAHISAFVEFCRELADEH